MALLGVNIDHVATVREARKIRYPDPVEAALHCQGAGADSIVCHLREDRRHIQDKDLYRLRSALRIKFNLEMSMSEDIIRIALDVKPDQVTLVPKKRKELTTEGGLNVVTQVSRVAKIMKRMRDKGIGVSLFIDPEDSQIRASKDAGVAMIELHTGRYANAGSKKEMKKQFTILEKAATLAKSIELETFAGHGLNYDNVSALRRIEQIREYNIGHSIIARAIFTGLKKAVKEMKGLIR